MLPPASRRDFDALSHLTKLLSQGQDVAAARANAIQQALDAAKAAQDTMAREIERQGGEMHTLRAVVIALLQQSSPHLPPALQGGVAAALQSLAAPRPRA